MKCVKHPDRDAVAQCKNCGAGVCSDCVKATEDLKESCGTLCVNCYSTELQDTAAFYRTRRNKRIKRIIISTILYIIGLVLLIIGGGIAREGGPGSANGVVQFVIGILLCGVFTGITWMKKAKEEHEEHERKYGASYTVTDSGVYRDTGFGMKLLYFGAGTVFGVVLTPVKVIKDIVGSVKDNKTAKMLIEESISVKNI